MLTEHINKLKHNLDFTSEINIIIGEKNLRQHLTSFSTIYLLQSFEVFF